MNRDSKCVLDHIDTKRMKKLSDRRWIDLDREQPTSLEIKINAQWRLLQRRNDSFLRMYTRKPRIMRIIFRSKYDVFSSLRSCALCSRRVRFIFLRTLSSYARKRVPDVTEFVNDSTIPPRDWGEKFEVQAKRGIVWNEKRHVNTVGGANVSSVNSLRVK